MGKRRWADWEDWGNGDSWQLVRGDFEEKFRMLNKITFVLGKANLPNLRLFHMYKGFMTSFWLTRYVCVFVTHVVCICHACRVYFSSLRKIPFVKMGLRVYVHIELCMCTHFHQPLLLIVNIQWKGNWQLSYLFTQLQDKWIPNVKYETAASPKQATLR